MNLPTKPNPFIRTPFLTWTRILLALAVAVMADGVQFLLLGFGWEGIDQAIDVATMLLTMWILGFHILLLPTFVVELIPVADMLPTWTGCVIAVIALRKRDQRPAPPPEKPIIDI